VLVGFDVAVEVSQVEEEWSPFVFLNDRERTLLNEATEFPIAH
jgi:hypothetical protein